MKIIAFYLPQFHEILENNAWWGEGFTEWVNVKKARSLFEGHDQPRIPLNKNYYDLTDDEVKEWQISIAKENGIYGFCLYHYWFSGHLLLQKPIEQFLDNKELKMPFCICWANEHWTKAWVSQKNTILIEQEYGEQKEWMEHFNYLLPFLKDERYIKNNGKPLLVIYRPELIDCLNDMLDLWQKLAIENGLKGIEFAYQGAGFDLSKKRDDSRFAYNIEYQPSYAQISIEQDHLYFIKKIKWYIAKFLDKNGLLHLIDNRPKQLGLRDYDAIWQRILTMEPTSEKSIAGAFVDYDNTPRKGENGNAYLGVTAEKFQKYLTKQIARARDVYKKDMLFMFAWNEWAESGYLEPDEKNGFDYLEAIKNALIDNDEFPDY